MNSLSTIYGINRDNLDINNLDGSGAVHQQQRNHNRNVNGHHRNTMMMNNVSHSPQRRKMNNDVALYWRTRFMAIEKAVKSGGVVVREQSERLAIGRNIIRNY